MNSKTTKNELLNIIKARNSQITELEKTIADLRKKVEAKKSGFHVIGIRKFTTEAFTEEVFEKWIKQSTPISATVEVFEDFDKQELIKERMWYRMANEDYMLVESTHRNEPNARLHRIVTFYANANGVHNVKLEAIE